MIDAPGNVLSIGRCGRSTSVGTPQRHNGSVLTAACLLVRREWATPSLKRRSHSARGSRKHDSAEANDDISSVVRAIQRDHELRQLIVEPLVQEPPRNGGYFADSQRRHCIAGMGFGHSTKIL